MNQINSPLVRIGVFYDGNYFLKISDYYYFQHDRKARISLEGLHEFIRQQVAEEEDVDVRLSQIIDSHFFRGRLSATEARDKDRLFHDRLFDDILMNLGINTHYMPLKTRDGRLQEKGIDVWLSLEAYELAMYKSFDVVVLIAGDSDYAPLIKKLNTLGTRVMLLNWDFKYTDYKGENRVTRASQQLLSSATYPVDMHDIIDQGLSTNEELIENMFVAQSEPTTYPTSTLKPVRPTGPTAAGPVGTVGISTIKNLKNGFGFVVMPPNNLFFSYADMAEGDFNDLNEGDWVEFTVGRNHRDEDCARNVRKVQPPQMEDGDEYEDDEEQEHESAGSPDRL
ncbi:MULTISPECIES: NYN domain-containing protein [Hymenobacter]|uniref:NYN domain-containing protein n=3 Tax=Hymenobacter TaxID=89966 RepID=A0ABR7MLN5_9BACT|nr:MULTISPECIES: NYN domain-containing protein [Hymenobacter]MBC6611961.1 NYN domain-containing protein [Hymenobacter citatus]MBO3269983.1 NYN domain-containing protein [Hymenobacter defluvii]MBW3130325.1 NYN domain-containing protein [Hymenobacter profundi]QNE40850.1 NYN domain-containing protein [Hymenobacter sp. NBH84]